jgi:cob(I)alamin adenosyltransferase
MRLTKIYTKVGDKGTTLLASGAKVPKDSLRIETYGTVDELNSFLGLLRDALTDAGKEPFADITAKLYVIQNEIFDLGGELATPLEILNTERQQVVNAASIARLEAEIDALNEPLPPLANFVLPGGHQANSVAHVCRTVCRRAERLIVALARDEKVRDEPRIYLNRLSDWLFVVGRVISARLGLPEVLWQQRGK